MTEEEAFWTFTSLIENIMPIDYFQFMAGANVDQAIFNQLMAEKLPRLQAHFEETGYSASMVTL